MLFRQFFEPGLAQYAYLDFLSAAREFAERRGTRVYLSDEGGDDWASDWARGDEYDSVFLKDGDTFRLGGIEVRAVHTPGHTPEHASARIEEIGFEDVDRLRHDENVAVVDVRFAAECASGHIPGAINASYTRLPSYARERLPGDRTLLVHCAAGGRSAVAAWYLAHEGFDVRFVDERLDAWQQAGGEVVRDEPAEASPADTSRETAPVA